MRNATIGLLAALVVGAASPALADPPAKEVEAKMTEYFQLWNAHDAAGVTKNVYRFADASNPMSTQTGVEKSFADLKAQGYDRSVMASLEGCLLSRDSALAEMRFTRLRTDGTPLGPKDRVALYQLRRFPDGWRITQMIPISLTAHLNCKSATE